MRTRPRACEALLAATVAAYVLVMLIGMGDPDAAGSLVASLSLDRSGVGASPWTLLTYQFAHDNPFTGGDNGGSGLYRLLHLGFNMLGLWVFGRPLEDRIGHVGLLLLYLGGGMLAGVAHLLTTPASVIGASGSVCALVGAFAMLLPRVHIRVLVIFILIGFWSIPATWVVLFWIVLDLVGFAGGGGTTAYAAHLGGYAAGLVGGIGVLLLGKAVGDDVDALWLFRQWRRRRAGRAALARPPRAQPAGERHKERSSPTASKTTDGPSRIWLHEIESAMQAGRTEGAMQRWKRTAPDQPDACLTAAVQLDLANHLQAAGDWEAAADAYERLLRNHSDHREAPLVRLLLGVLLARRLDRFEEAKSLLERAREELDDSRHVELADEILNA